MWNIAHKWIFIFPIAIIIIIVIITINQFFDLALSFLFETKKTFYKISYKLPASQNMTKVICLENKLT